jgi:Ca2+-binding EF-hand superfamily protein
MHLFKLTDQQLTQMLIPERFVPPTPPEYEGKNVVYVFDSDDKFELTYDELVEIISKARQAGPRMIPVLGTVN